MKTILLICLLSLIGWNATAKDGKLTIQWTYLNVVEGYDHENKIAVWIDGERKGESSSCKATQTGTHTLLVPQGVHSLRIVGYSYYEGNWEEHTIVNEYSVDAILEETFTFTKTNTLNIAWDLDQVEDHIVFTNGKPSKAEKKKLVPLVVSWKYSGIAEGYDHMSRTKVYVDGQLVGTSAEQKQSKPGKLQVKVTKGEHEVRIVAEAFYEGRWEEHTRENDYSVDAVTEATVELKSKNSVQLLFDIETEKTTVTWGNR